MTYIFDLDGTLIDSRYRHVFLMKNILERHGISDCGRVEDGSYIEYKANGFSGRSFLRNILALDEQICEEIQEEWIHHIEDDELLFKDKLFPDTMSTCKRILDQAQNTIFFLTARRNENGLKKELEHLGLNFFASEIAVVDPYEKSKDTALKEIVKRSRKAMMIGDTEVDYEAALKADIPYYMLNRGFRSEQFWNCQRVTSYPSLESLMCH